MHAEEILAGHLKSGVEALGRGDNVAAVASLRIVVADPALRASGELDDVRARALSLLAQAHLALGELSAADDACRESLRILRRARDRDGLLIVREVQDRITKALAYDAEQRLRAEERARTAATSLETLLAGVTSPVDRAAVLTRKANAELDAERQDVAIDLAEQAIALALGHGAVTELVLARITLAQALPERAESILADALNAATDANEFNLVSMIARAAELSAVRLPTLNGPDMSWRDA